uniref:Ubiquitinyl hydrolase 1 n=1 Tax=Panagrolaimus sp. JU765 TaxID=591449 RepID=A0AC34QSK7_9BILA
MSSSRIPECNLYHEKQEKQMCLLHAINNLLQKRVFNKEDLDKICLMLNDKYWFNPHRSMLGLGNYDVNVLMTALLEQNLSVTWFDNRLRADSIVTNKIVGYIFNTQASLLWYYLTKGRHWFAVLKTSDGKYYNLDSKLPRPKLIEDFHDFVNDHLDKGNELLLVTKPEDADSCIIKRNSK